MYTAVIFPGQGSQVVGMGKDLPGNFFEKSDKILGYPLSSIMFEGSQEELNKTENTQPALLTHSMALWAVLQKKTGLKADFFAGHSLGEYSAVTAAGGFSFEDAVLAVHNRGKYMQSAVGIGVGGMLAVLGAADDAIAAVCDEVSRPGSIVEPANYNTVGQVVVAGEKEALERFSVLMKERGAKRIIPLPVSVPSHCSLMKPAQAEMQKYLDKLQINDLNIPVINNATAEFETGAEVVKEALIKQMSGAVLWTQSVKKLIDKGVNRFIEVGSGSVLTGLIKKIDREVQCINITSYEDVQKLG